MPPNRARKLPLGRKKNITTPPKRANMPKRSLLRMSQWVCLWILDRYYMDYRNSLIAPQPML